MSIEHKQWGLGIGDPSVIAWLTVAAYFIVAIICFKAATVGHPANPNRPAKLFWGFLAFSLVVLGINKQLDFQSLFTQIGRDMAISQGWYHYRRFVQIGFIALIGVLGLTGFIVLLKAIRHSCLAVKTAFAGYIILFVFIMLRASTFHHVDALIGMRLSNVKMNLALELGALAIMAIGGMKYLYNMRAFPDRP